MRDDDLAFVERVHRDLRDVRWPEPEEIRATARRRRRRTAAFAAVAVLAAVTGPAYALKERPEAPPTAATRVPVDATTAADIPQEALLTPAEVPAPTGVQLGDAGLGEAVRLDPALQRCGDERGVPAARVYSRYSRSQTLLSPTKEGATAVRVQLSQDVYRLAPAVGAQLFTELRMLLDACPERHVVENVVAAGEATPNDSKHAWQAAATNFAGDESVLVRDVPYAPRGPAADRTLQPSKPVGMTVVVRVGDLVTVLVPNPDLDLREPDLETLGRTAAQRLCPAANPAC
ncbi:hypothetical protein OOJ91_25675 [Micromonospora lupini]|uniref:hypothetical protein n=1 Tax=Micromonospora lupini TaxID=285679 RepID=UPI002258EE22|nr:hypothetical protein [Micromonospora lupini]MCX5069239.1 hypothetical protein [Micromonospora lupini]